MPKNRFLQTPAAGDIEEIFKQGAEELSRLSLPEFPGETKQKTPKPEATETAAAPSAPRRGSAPTAEDIIRRATELGIDPAVPLAIWGVESGANFNSKDSPKGAVGGMQVMPGTYRMMMGTDEGMRDPWNNMEAGLRYIAYGQKKLGTKDPALLAAGYHAGYDREDLKRGVIPGTHDGIMSTRDYAAKVAGKVSKTGLGAQPVAAAGEFEELSPEEVRRLGLDQGNDRFEELSPQEVERLLTSQTSAKPATEDRGFFDRAGNAWSRGAEGTMQSLETARFIMGGGDSAELARNLARRFQAEAARPKTEGEQEIDAAFQEVTDAKGAWNTVKASAKAVGTAITNPKDLAVGIIEQAPNMLPTLGAGVAGAGTGAAVGGGIGAAVGGAGAVPGAVTGAVIGGRAGMVAGTTATELGAEVQEMILKRLTEQKQLPTEQNIKALLDDPQFQAEARKQGLAKGLTVAAIDQVFLGLGGKIAGKAASATTKTGKVGYGAAAVGIDAAGETTGEAVSQAVARGEVDKGEALREGVYGLGQSTVEPVIGYGLSKAGQAARALRDTPAQPQPPAPAQPPAAPAQPATTPAPAQPTGPIGRALQKATGAAEPQPAPDAVELPRVRITDANGQAITGFAEQIGPDGSGRVIGDDGQVYQFTAQDGVTIEPIDQPAAQAPAAPAQAAQPEPAEPAIAAVPEPVEVPVAEEAPPPAAPSVEPAAESAAPAVQPGDDATWTKDGHSIGVKVLGIEDRGGQPYARVQAGRAETYAPVSELTKAPKVEVVEPEAVKVEPQEVAKPAKAADRPLTEWTEQELRERLRYLTSQAKMNGGWNSAMAAERRKVSAEIDRRNAQGKESADADVRVRDDGAARAEGAEAQRAGQPGGRPADAQPADGRVAQPAGAAVPAAGNAVPGADQAADAQPALTDPAAGRWFGSREKAEAFIAKKGLAASHEVVQTGKVRFEVKPKAPQAAAGDGPAATDGNARPAPAAAAVQADGVEGALGQIFTGKSALFDGYGASIGSITEGNKRQLMVDPGGGYFWGDWRQEAQRDVGAVAGGADKDATPATFATSKEAREAAAATPVTKTAPTAPAQSATDSATTDAQQVTPAITSEKWVRDAADPFEGMNLPDQVKEYLLKPSVTMKDGSTVSPKDFVDGLLADGYGNPEYFVAPKGSQVGFLSKPGSPKATLNDKQMFYADAAFMAKKRAQKKQEQAAPSPSPAPEQVPAEASRPADDGAAQWNALTPAGRRAAMKAAGVKLPDAVMWEHISDANKQKLRPVVSNMLEHATEPQADPEPAATQAGDAKTDDKESERAWWDHRPGDVVYARGPDGKAVGLPQVVEEVRNNSVGAPLLYKDGKILGRASEFTRTPPEQAEPAPASDAGKADPFAGNKLFTSDKVAAARERLRKKLSGSQLNSGIDPELLMDGMTIAGAYIESGVRNFTQYAARMVQDMGDGVKPYLLSFWEAARHYPGLDTKGMTSVEESKRLHEQMLAPEAKILAAAQASPKIDAQERAHDDGQATAGAAGDGAQGQGARGAQPDAGGRDAERLPVESDRADAGGDQRGAAGRDRRPGERGEPDVRAGYARPDAGDQHGDEGGRGDRAGAGDRDDRGPVSRVGDNYRIQPGELKRAGSWRATAEQNVRIVELVKQLEREGRRPTPEEAALLTKFTGWGATEIANGIFPDRYGRYKDAAWQALGERLKAALTPEEYAQARRTTQYAHYTSEGVIRSIYDGLRRLGFAGGRVLEPGMGIGLFNGLMPADMAASSQYTGVEYDGITGAIAKLLYPQSNVIVGDYTKTALPREFFDAAIGNPPFGSIAITNDPEYKKHGFMLHDYFFAKTIDRVKPGGLVVFVTSKGTMDKANDRARKYLAERANLLGAIRLPQTAFKDNAGTEVVTDVIFLQKRGPGIEDNGVKWLGTADVQTPQGPATINEYFAAHPEMVLGAHALTGSMYRANEYTVVPEPGVDLEQAFARAVANLPEGVYRPGAKNPVAAAAVARERDFNPTHKKEGGLYVAEDGRLMQVESGTGVELTHRRGADGKLIALKPNDKAFLKSWVGLRDALKQAQLDQLTDGDWEKSLKALAAAYDAFVAKHGNLLAYSSIERENEDGTVTVTKRFKNDPLLRLDVDGALAYSLEHIKETGEIVKAPVLSQRVLQKRREPEIKTTQDALFVSLNALGRLDLDDVARRAGMSRQEVIDALGTAIYEAPGEGWQTADEYLSGNVVRKLKEAEAAARADKRYQRNVEALLAVQPKPLGPTEITVKLGQNWIPPSDIMAFAREALNEDIRVSYNPRLGAWSAEQNGSNYSEFNTPKMSAGAILDAVLNNRTIRVTYRDEEGKTHVDAEATEKANDVARKMREAFSRWIWTDTKRADRLVNYYNEHFNNIAPRQFDGSHLTLPGVSLRFNLYPHQKRAIWRMVQEGDTYLAHSVGAGKTFTMIAAGMEERRLGLSNKPMYVVPNHMLAQFAREFLELYPAANIMVADEQNFHTHNRRRFVAQAALNDPDAIIITHSAFSRIGMSDEFAERFIADQIEEWKRSLDETDQSDRITRKQIERRIEQLERRLEARQNRDKKDQVLSFEELGVDRLFVDEAHEFRKLDFATNQGNIKGIDPAGSQRAMDLFMKVQYLRSKKPSRALVMASGTPITNTMGELFTVQRFFQPDQLAEDGLDTFDAWANQYGDVVAGFEQNAAGGYEVVSRFAKFQNVPELMRRVRSFMDILTSSSLGELVQRPAVKGGGREIVVTPEPDGYRAYQKTLEARINAIRQRKGPPKKGEDIILNVIADGRFSAIDMRFVDPGAPSDPKSKLNRALDDLIAAYFETADHEYTTGGQVDPIKGSSLILFTDIGLGEQSAKSRGFDMKAWIEKRLTDAGIPREHIAFMRDHKEHAKKERLFADMREGKKRILIGGKDMETGVNVQKRLTHLFHLDAPWFPASVEQREGRIVRQGNQNKEVVIRAYATKGSYDSTMWGMNGRKARFIEQALNGDDSVRSLEDVSEASAFEMAAALASGDERYLKLAGLKADVERLERLAHAHHDDQNKLRRDKLWAESKIERDRALVADLKAAIERRTPIRAGEFAGKVGRATYDKRDEFSNALFERFKALTATETRGEETIGEIGGFPITFYGGFTQGSGNYYATVEVGVPGDPEPLLSWPLDPQLAVGGLATRAANQVNALDRQLAEAEDRVRTNERRIEQIDQRLGAPFPEQAELLDKMAQLQALEIELTAEKAAEGGQPVSAEAAAATAEAQAQDEGSPKYSLAPGIDRDRPVPVTRIETFDVEPQALWRTADTWFRSNLSGKRVYNESLGGAIDFSGLGRSKVLSVGRRDPRRMSIVRALESIARNAVLVREEGDRKSREGVAGYTTLLAPVEIDGVLYGVSIKLRREARAVDPRSIFYTVEAFNLESASGGGVGQPTQIRGTHSTDALQDTGAAAAEYEPEAAAPVPGEKGASRASTTQRGQDRPSTDSEPGLGTAGNVDTQRAPASAPTLAQVTVGDLLDAINEANRAFSIPASPAVDGLALGAGRRPGTIAQSTRNSNVITVAELRNFLTKGALGESVKALLDRGAVVLHEHPASLPVKNVPRNAQAFTLPDGTIHLVARGLRPQTAQAVLLHEAFHQGGERLIGTKAWADLMRRLDSLYRQAERSSGRAREFFDAARARVQAARSAGVVSDAMTPEEFGAYTIEQYEQAPAAFRKWVDDLIGAVKAWLLRRFGIQAGQVTPAQLRALAVAALRDQAGVSLSIDDGNAIADTATYGPASPEHQRLADTLAGRLSRAYGRAIVLDAVAPGSGAVGGRGRELAAVSTVARRLFGHEVVFVRHRGEPLFNGAMSTAIPDVLFINADATKPMMAVLGHELLHHLKRTNKGIYNTLNNRLNRLKKNERDYLHRLEVLYGRQGAKAPANWDEELNADIVGDFFMDPEFWAAMAKDQPGLFRRVANAIVKFLDDVAAKIADIRPFGTDQYLTDIAAARAAVVDAMRQFSGAQVGAMTSQSEGINLSVSGLPDTITVDGKQRPTRNSAGQPIHPTEEGIRNFWRWAGDSKAVDEQGRPLVVYHGTTADIGSPEFKPYNRKGEQLGFGIHFAVDAKFADKYASDPNIARKGPSPQIIPVYLNIRNPLIADAVVVEGTPEFALAEKMAGSKLFTVKDEQGRRTVYLQNAIDVTSPQRAEKLIREAGYDGVRYTSVIRGRGINAGATSKGQSWLVFRPEQIKSATGNRGTFDAGSPDIRFSIAPEDADKALDAAAKALDAAPPVPRDDYVGRVVSDLSLGARLIVHPRTIAATFKEFAPVYNTAISQIEARDRHIAELGRGADAYTKLPQESKERVNKVLELGRLTAKTYTEQDLADGVGNPGHKVTVVVGEDGKPRPVREPIKALLTEVGEVVRLTEAEIKAYLDLRGMFDQALDKFRDQTLAEFGFEDLAGQPDAAKAIRGRITKDMDDAERERLESIANFIGEIEQAKRTGYVPFARYGDYVVTVKEKVADLEFVEDDAEHLIVKGVPAAFAGDLAALGATEAKKDGGWRIKKSQRRDVERLAEKTVYSAKVETGLADLIKGRKAGKVDELPAVKAAIEQARKAWVEGHPNRRIVAFRANQKQPDEAVRLSDVDALAEVANIDNATWDAVRDKLATAIQGRSFRKHFFHSDNVPGYTGDFERAIADYVIGMSGYLARREHQKRWDNALDRIPGDMPKLHQYASRYRDYVNSPQEEFAMVRQVGFFSYIAGVAATAFANLTQVPFLTVPTLAQVAPVPLVLKEVGRAYKDAIKMLSRKGGLDLFDPNKAPDDVRAAVKEAWDEGAFVPLETFDLMMMARQRNVGRRRLVKGFNDTTKVVSLFFTFAERLNRLVTFIAAARLSEKRAVRENAKRVLGRDALARSTILRDWTAKNFAEWAVDESQYRMGKANRPTAMRGVGAAIMQFKGFMLQTFEAWYRMAALHGKEGKFAAASSLVMLYAMAGVWGLPGAEDLRKLIEAAYKALTDRDLDLKTELRAWVARTSGSNVLAQAVTKGASYPLGVDLTRVGMGTVFPDSPLAAAGIPFDMLIGRPKRAFEKASTGDHFGAAGEMSPNFLKHWLVAGGWATGGVRDKKGDLILPADRLETGDLVMKGLGFQPSIVTDVRDYNYAQYRQETAVDGLKRRFTARIARTLVEMERAGEAGDTKKLEALEAELAGIYDELAEHNESAPPEHQIQLGRRAIANRMMREREGVMARWGKERRAARGAAEELRGVFGLSEEADERGEDDGQE